MGKKANKKNARKRKQPFGAGKLNTDSTNVLVDDDEMSSPIDQHRRNQIQNHGRLRHHRLDVGTGLFSEDEVERSSKTDDTFSGAYIDHRIYDQPSKGSVRRKKSTPAKSTDRARLSNKLNQDEQLPLTNRNLKFLQQQKPIQSGYTERQYGSIALDMDKYTDEQRKLARNHANPFKSDDERGDTNSDDDFLGSNNSLEFGASNPSSDHSSDSTSLDDVCFPDYYDDLGVVHYRDNFEWPDLKILEQFVEEELEEAYLANEEREEHKVSFANNVNFQQHQDHSHSKGKTASPLVSPNTELSPSRLQYENHENSREGTPLLQNYQTNEVETLALHDSMRVRPTPIQPWEKSREQIPTILNNKKQRGDSCRFTYFREDLEKTVHSPTISGLIAGIAGDTNTGDDDSDAGVPDDTPRDVDVAAEAELLQDEDGGIYAKLQDLFQPHSYSNRLSRSPSSYSVGNILTPPQVSVSQVDSGGNSAFIGTPNLLSPLTKLQGTLNDTPIGTRPPTPNGERRDSLAEGTDAPAPLTPFWLDILDPTEEEMKVLSKTFGIHPLTTEDIFLGETREKVELFKSYYFICFTSFDIVYERRKQRKKEQDKKLSKLQEMYENSSDGDSNSIFGSPERKSKIWSYIKNLVGGGKPNLARRSTYDSSFVQSKGSRSTGSKKQKKIREGELQPLNMYMIVYKDAVITFHFSPTPHPINVRRRARLLRDYLTVSSDWICYALVDDITDSFAPMIESIEEEVNQIEDAILKMHSGDTDDSDSDSELDSESEQEVDLRKKLITRKATGTATHHDSNIFFKRLRLKSTVDHGAISSRFTHMKSNSTKSNGSRRSSKSSKSTAILGWKRKGDMLRRIGECRKRVMSVLRLLGTKADVIRAFSKRFSESYEGGARDALRSEIGMYLGDIQDHIVTMVQSLNHYEKLLARFHSNYLAQINIDMTKVNNDTNDVLGKITILGTIVLPINVVTGLWGMNCIVPGQDVAGLTWFYGIVLSMCLFSIFAYNYAKRVTGL